MSAGLGTRLKPWTNEHPKALALVNGKPLLQRNIEYLQQFGIREIVVNIHHFADQIRAAVHAHNGWGSRVTFSDETHDVLETGGGLVHAQKLLEGEGDFVVMNVDILTDLDIDSLVQNHLQSDALATLATTNRTSTRHLLFDADNQLAGWENTLTGEKKIARDIAHVHPAAFSGVHVISDRIFPLIRQKGKFSIIDTYLDLTVQHKIMSYDHSGGKLIDVGKPESIAKAEQLF